MIFRMRYLKDERRIPDRPIRDLGVIVAKDYERRILRQRPDRLHEADAALMLLGWIVEGPL